MESIMAWGSEEDTLKGRQIEGKKKFCFLEIVVITINFRQCAVVNQQGT